MNTEQPRDIKTEIERRVCWALEPLRREKNTPENRARAGSAVRGVMHNLLHEGTLRRKMPVVDVNAKLLTPRIEQKLAEARQRYDRYGKAEDLSAAMDLREQLAELDRRADDPTRLDVYLLDENHDLIENWERFATWGT